MFCELAVDALYPELLGDWLVEAIEPYWSAADREPILRAQKEDRKLLKALAGRWDEVRDYLDEAP